MTFVAAVMWATIAALALVGDAALASSEPTPPTGRVVASLSAGSASWIVERDLGDPAWQAVTPAPERGELRQDDEPTWSADGSMIAFRRLGVRPGRSGLFVIKSDGTELRRVATFAREETYDLYPAWSPDGERLAFDPWSGTECQVESRFDLRFVVATLNGDTHTVHALARPAKTVFFGPYRWAPDGTRLLYTVVYPETGECRTMGGQDANLHTVAADGSGRKLVVRGFVVDAVWSPDSKEIAYLDCTDDWTDGCDLFVMRADGTDRRRLVRNTLQPFSFSWTPDGTGVLITDSRSVAVVSVLSRRVRLLSTWRNRSDSFADILAVSDDSVAVIGGQTFGPGPSYRTIGVRIRIVPLGGGSSREIRLKAPQNTDISSYDVFLD